ncbi:molybdopterin molybdenumtransferase MoeA [Bremerella cremea]|uniref:Molybdopterin molybdenumtransferase n=1 Tax=Bremerella cremea TaxID=1031537 RepID=A0A368KSP5_9BACT|nr:gephyrin-like molybdotransferase Glp [Bremerella cremea]RCS52675.1 molybdopterin molybdenumtransferase MoeA [Bremerella cremea]
MHSVEEALELIGKHSSPLPDYECDAVEALGSAMAEDLTSEQDSPAFDKSMMDGYAVIAADLEDGPANLEVVDEIAAGVTSVEVIRPGTCARIMTGAPMPPGADAVALVEHTQIDSENVHRVMITEAVTPGKNVLKRGSLLSKGQVVLSAGSRIRPIEVGILSDMAKGRVTVHRSPSISIISTGDELVSAQEEPISGQIRNSNGPMLEAMAIEAGAQVIQLGIVKDKREDLAAAISKGLESDILILSGGVSSGVLDLVPAELTAHGVEQIFHKVCIKPGKPLWFGKRVSAGKTTLVFGLPGNPVSSLVCFHLFVRCALNQLQGRAEEPLHVPGFLLTRDFVNNGDRPVYFPAMACRKEGAGATLSPLNWKGSADLATLAKANALAIFAPNSEYEAGQFISAIMI